MSGSNHAMDVVIIVLTLVAGAAWGHVIRETFFNSRAAHSAHQHPGKKTNLILILILTLLGAWFTLAVTSGCSIDTDNIPSMAATDCKWGLSCDSNNLCVCTTTNVHTVDGGTD